MFPGESGGRTQGVNMVTMINPEMAGPSRSSGIAVR